MIASLLNQYHWLICGVFALAMYVIGYIKGWLDKPQIPHD